jgi:hypothetical protein
MMRTTKIMTLGTITLCAMLAILRGTGIAQNGPVYPDGNKIEGVWDSQLIYRNCATGDVLSWPMRRAAL